MKHLFTALLIISSIIITSCGGEKKATIEDTFDPIKYSTHLYSISKDPANKEMFDGKDVFKLSEIVEDNKSFVDSLKGKKYNEVVEFLVDYENEKPARELAQLKSQLEKEIESLKDGFDGSDYRETVPTIQIELALFELWKDYCKKAAKSKDKEVKKLGETLKKKVSRVQVKEFPKLRKAYAEVADKLMWESNIDVKASGSGYSRIMFTGGSFASNRNIKDTYVALIDIIKMLRFKQLNFEWRKGASEYTSYDLKPKKDSEL